MIIPFGFLKTAVNTVNLVENGTFDGNSTTGWTIGSNWVVTNNELQGTAAFAFCTYILPSDPFVDGDNYRVELDITSYTSGGISVRAGSTTDWGSFSSAGHHTVNVTAGSSVTVFQINDSGGGFTGAIDNILVYKL